MNRRNIIIFILALIALAVISWDYTSGHSLENILRFEYCPVCDVFKSAAMGIILLFLLVFLGLLPVFRFSYSSGGLIPLHRFNSSVISDRAPPFSL